MKVKSHRKLETIIMKKNFKNAIRKDTFKTNFNRFQFNKIINEILQDSIVTSG